MLALVYVTSHKADMCVPHIAATHSLVDLNCSIPHTLSPDCGAEPDPSLMSSTLRPESRVVNCFAPSGGCAAAQSGCNNAEEAAAMPSKLQALLLTDLG